MFPWLFMIFRDKRNGARVYSTKMSLKVSDVQRSGDARGDWLVVCPLPNFSIEQWRMVIIVTGSKLFVTSQYDVIFMFTNQRFGEVCWHNMHIILHSLCSFLTLNSGPHQANHKNQLMHFTDFIRTSQQNVINENYGEQPCAAETLCLKGKQRLCCKDAKTYVLTTSGPTFSILVMYENREMRSSSPQLK